MFKFLGKYKVLIFAAIIVPLFQCALLNTFYNGRNSYKVTYKAHQKLIKENPDSTIELSEELIKGYDRAVDKGNKVLKVYPQKIKWHDNAIFLKARAQLMKGEYTFAVTNLKELQSRFPESPFIPESWLLLGKAYLYKENYNKAEEALRYVLDKYPKLDKNGEVTLLLVQVSVNREGRSKAIQKLEEALNTLKSEDQILEIVLQLSDLYIELKLYTSAIKTLKRAPRLRDNIYKIYRVDLNLVRAYRLNNKIDKALEVASKMLKNARYNKYRPVILLEKGYVYRDKDDLEEALKVFEDIIPLEGYNNVRGLAAFELGKMAQFKDGDYDAALKWYEEALKLLVDKEVKEKVQLKIDGLNDRKQYLAILNEIELSDSVAKDTTVADSNFYQIRYKLGEVYWLTLNEPDSALKAFENVCSDSLADSVTVMKAVYGLAWISMNMKSDTAAADSLFSMIIEKYPATVAAKKAQEALGMEVTISTREDSALAAYAEAEILWMEKGKGVKAVNSFYKLSNNYSDLEDIAASALYSAGWICDNVLHKNKNALKFYRKLCEEFPESGLCKDEAAPRIKVVDDTLAVLKAMKGGVDDILENQTIEKSDSSQTQSIEDSSSTDTTENNDSTESDTTKVKLKRKKSRRGGPSSAITGPGAMGPMGPGLGSTRPVNNDSLSAEDEENKVPEQQKKDESSSNSSNNVVK